MLRKVFQRNHNLERYIEGNHSNLHVVKSLYSIFIPTFSLSCLLFFTSCDKFHARKLSGTYTCQVHTSSYMMGSYNTDTAYIDNLIVKHKDKNVIVLNDTIPIDSLWDGSVYYVGSGPNYFKIQFINDSIYYSSHSGGLGGGYSSSYAGKKQ